MQPLGFASFAQHKAFQLHPSCCVYNSSFVLLVTCLPWYGHSLFIHSPIERNLDYFQFVVIVVIVSILLQIFMCMIVCPVVFTSLG